MEIEKYVTYKEKDSNCTTFNNRKFIRPVFDGISTIVTQYQVVDELGQLWFQGTKEDCEQFLYSC